MSLADGTRLEHYAIVGPLGAGGMGEVYRAVDTKLRREVAIKILPAKFANDPSRLARFEREAHLLASLNHPNIAAIYGLEHIDGIRFLVLELVEGPTLSERLKSGPMEVGEALGIAAQIAEAFEAAHEKGVVHRDLKPGNVKITPAGKVKVLDFGLAKALGDSEPTAASSNPEAQSTATLQETKAGVVMGTAAYMSPEQAEGKPTDKRSDVWSFGVVLYEMLSGKRCFDGKSTSHVLVHVLEQEPNWERLPGTVPVGVRSLMERCLQKNPASRLRDIGDLRLQLQAMEKEAASVSKAARFVPPPRRVVRAGLLWPTVGSVLALATVLLALYFRSKPIPSESVHEPFRFQILPPENGVFDNYLALSPDGRRLTFTSKGADGRVRLWVRNMDTLESRALAGTENASSPFWSPDSHFLAYVDGSKLKRIDILGGPPQVICEVPGLAGQGAWNSDDVIVFGQRATGTLWRVPAAGGLPSRLTSADQKVVHGFPSFLPDNKHFIYTKVPTQGYDGGNSTGGVYVGSLDAKPEQQMSKKLLSSTFNTVYVRNADEPSGRLLSYQDGTLMAQTFDLNHLELIGEPVPIAEQIGQAFRAYGFFTASANGVLAFRGGSEGVVRLTWFDRQGKVLGTMSESANIYWPSISPDGDTVAFDRRNPQTGLRDIWLHDLARDSDSRFTFGPGVNQFPVWSPDNKYIAFQAGRDQLPNVYVKAIRGATLEQVVDPSAHSKRPDDWSRDGRYIIEQVSDPKTKEDIWVLPMFGDHKPFPYLQTEFNEIRAKLSPNGQWLAYVSDETKQTEVYVQTFPTPGRKWQISTKGGTLPVWSRDGRELFFIGADRKLMAVDFRNGPASAGVPTPLFDTRFDMGLGVGNDMNPWYDVSRDGRFLIPSQSEQIGSAPITVVVNWAAALKK